MKRLSACVSALGAGALLLALVLCAPQAAEGVRTGLRVAAETALPALFPFFVAGSLMVRTGLSAALGRFLTRPFYRLYGLAGAGASALALGLLGGYPVGAQATVQLFRAKQLTQSEAEHLLGFANCSGPAFLVSMCGAAVCGSLRAGLLLYAVHIAAALMTGFALTRSAPPPSRPAPLPQSEPFASAFVGAVSDGMTTALKVTAFIVFFAVLLALAEALGLLPLFAAALEPLLLATGLPPEAAEASAAALLELTNGLARLPALGLPARQLFPLLSALVAFGGLSVHCQTLSLLAGTGLSARYYFFGKTLHAVLAYALASIWCAAFPHTAPVFAAQAASVPTFSLFPSMLAIVPILFSFGYGKFRRNAL